MGTGRAETDAAASAAGFPTRQRLQCVRPGARAVGGAPWSPTLQLHSQMLCFRSSTVVSPRTPSRMHFLMPTDTMPHSFRSSDVMRARRPRSSKSLSRRALAVTAIFDGVTPASLSHSSSRNGSAQAVRGLAHSELGSRVRAGDARRPYLPLWVTPQMGLHTRGTAGGSHHATAAAEAARSPAHLTQRRAAAPPCPPVWTGAPADGSALWPFADRLTRQRRGLGSGARTR